MPTQPHAAKAAARSRQRQTGEKYTTALRHVTGSHIGRDADPAPGGASDHMAPGEDEQRAAAALALLEATDPDAAGNARFALNWIAGEGLDLRLVTVRAVQDFCWHDMPLEDPDECEDITDGLARLLDLLQVPQHAAVCRSPATQEILWAYWKDEGEGLKAYRRAAAASGLAPPSLPGFEWGSEEKPWAEAAAWQSTSRMLEEAVTTGTLVPGRRGWKDLQQELTQAHLNAARPELGGRSHAEAVISERLEAWADAYDSPEHEEAINAITSLLLRPARLPDEESANPLPRWQWFLDQLGEGIPLTQNGNIARAFVRANAARFGFDSGGWQPSFDRDLEELQVLRTMATRLRLAARSGRKLTLTPRGRRLMADPAALWRATARLLIGGGELKEFAGELFLLLLAAGRALPADEVYDTLGRAVVEAASTEKFTRGLYGVAADEYDAARAAQYTVWRCRALGLFAHGAGDQMLAKTYQLTPVGAATALEALRAWAARPLLPADSWADQPVFLAREGSWAGRPG
jgi:hypothetical protein